MSEKTWKVVTAVIVAAITVIGGWFIDGKYIHVFVNFDETVIVSQSENPYSPERIDDSKNSDDSKSSSENGNEPPKENGNEPPKIEAMLKITAMMPSINTSLHSSFLATITNESMRSTASNVQIEFDFGGVKMSNCEVIPSRSFDTEQLSENSILKSSIGDIMPERSVRVYCLMDNPTFDSLTAQGSNTGQPDVLTYEEYRSNNEGHTSFWKTLRDIALFLIVAGPLIVIFWRVALSD